MTGNPGIHVLSDARWAELEPLINKVRPPCKVPHDNLRQTIEAIVWRHQNGAKWRAIPGELGPWWKAAQTLGWFSSQLDLARPVRAPVQYGWPKMGPATPSRAALHEASWSGTACPAGYEWTQQASAAIARLTPAHRRVMQPTRSA
jgi:transposase